MTTAIVQTSTTATVTSNYAPDQNPALVYLASLQSEHSRRAMRQSLDTIAKLVQPDMDAVTFPWHSLRYQHTQALRSQLATTCSAATGNRHLSALRGVLKEAWRLGHMTAEDYHRAIDFKNIKGENTITQAEKGRHLKPGELAALMAVCNDGTAAGARDAALFALAYAGGLRRSELVSLQVDDWNQDDGALTVRGKGNKQRRIPVADGAREALAAWLDVRGETPGAIFTRINKGSNITWDALTEQAIYFIMSERAKQANVKDFTPHDMRRTFAGDLLDTGADISTVQKLMGHSNPATTASYDRRGERIKRDAVNKLHVPYQPRR
jgi:site-specific recombinase XerD